VFLRQRESSDILDALAGRCRSTRHVAPALKGGTIFDHQARRLDIGQEFSARRYFNSLMSLNTSANRSRNEDPADLDLGFDVAVLTHDQITVRNDAALEPAVQAKGVLEVKRTLNEAAGIEKAIEIALCSCFLHLRLPVLMSMS